MPASIEGWVYFFVVVDYDSNLGWPISLKDEFSNAVTHASCVFLAAIKPLREKHG